MCGGLLVASNMHPGPVPGIFNQPDASLGAVLLFMLFVWGKITLDNLHFMFMENGAIQMHLSFWPAASHFLTT